MKSTYATPRPTTAAEYRGVLEHIRRSVNSQNLAMAREWLDFALGEDRDAPENKYRLRNAEGSA